MLTDDQRRALLDLARRSITAAVTGQEKVDVARSDLPEASGVFVTIKRQGQLRGCLGTLQARGDLAAEIARCAADSATEDPRFSPVQPGELTDLVLDISVLGPLESIEPGADAITVGVHGLVVEQGSKRGLLLPQVASECGWSAEEFLRHTCVKAGLAPDAWKRGAAVFRFSAEVFGE